MSEPNLVALDTYGFLSFTGETEKGPFWKIIPKGVKTQTIRKPRSDNRDHVKPGKWVKLYWRVRAKKEKKKPVHFIGYAKVISYEKRSLLSMIFDEENAEADGFKNLDEFREWFYPEWFRLSPIIRETLEKFQAYQYEYIINYGRRLGKSTLRNQLESLLDEYYVIKWETPILVSEETKEVLNNDDL